MYIGDVRTEICKRHIRVRLLKLFLLNGTCKFKQDIILQIEIQNIKAFLSNVRRVLCSSVIASVFNFKKHLQYFLAIYTREV